MEHPLVTFRNSHHLSQDDLANLCGITKQIVTFAEQGIYPELPPAIMKGIRDEYGLFATEGFQEKNSTYIRQELDKLDISVWLGIHNGDPDVVPARSFVEWRSLISSSVTNFGKLVKIQPITIRKYESGKTHNLPIQLEERLKYFGFSNEYIRKVGQLPIN
jgi:transcriptional regulator with XRE-family HTH domain